MQNIAPARALARRGRNLLFVSLLVLAVGVVAAVAGWLLQVIPLVVPSNPSYNLYVTVRSLIFAVGLVLALLALMGIVRALTWRRDNPLATHVGEVLSSFLGENFVYIRNVSKLSLGYIDAVLVGPPGALVMRISDREGVYYNEGAHWLRQEDRGEWATMRWNPTREAVDDIQRLRAFLAARQLDSVPVFGVVVFTKDPPLTQVTTEKPIVPVTHASALSYDLSDSYFAADRIDPSVVQRVVQILIS